MDIGIIGLPKSGKTTIFNGLTRGTVDTGSRASRGLLSHVGVAHVPDARLESLDTMLKPKRLVSAEARYIDIGASVKDLVIEKGIGGQLLNQLSAVDELINVVRAFADESVPHVEGSLNVERDIATMNLELTFSDLAILEKKLERIETSLKGAKASERQAILREQELVTKIKAGLERGIPIREMELSPEEVRNISNYQFLTAKPLLIVVNIGEDQLPEANYLETKLNSQYSKSHCRVIAMCGKLEMELSQLENSAAEELRTGFDLKESGLERIVRESYGLLGLITFFTTASDEVRAWSIKQDTEAVKAAGKIHSDMERGFIRAEVINYEELVKCGSLAEARKKGHLRLEGKNYEVKDGDVITFLFNI